MQTVDKVIMALGKQRILQKQIPQIQFDDTKVTLRFEDGTSVSVNNRALRLSCRCALCVNELTGDQLLKEKSIRPDIAPREITALGNYAIGIHWNDGHASGIYPYETIKSLADV